MRALFSQLLDLLYPPKCVICRRLLARGERDICPDCFESLPNFEGEKPRVGGADGLSVTLFYEGADPRPAAARAVLHGVLCRVSL